MRRVKLLKRVYNPDTKKYDNYPNGEGNFIEYGVDYEEFESGAGNYSCGIIEMDDGTVSLEPIGNFEFTDKAPF